MSRLASFDVLTEEDVFTLRRLAHDAAEAVGVEGHDQVRVATALSEVGREVLRLGPATVQFVLEIVPPRLVVTVGCAGVVETPTGAPGGELTGIVAAVRLLDSVDVATAGGRSTVTLTKRLHGPVPRDRVALDRARARLRLPQAQTSPLDELRRQNSELAGALSELRTRSEDLAQANAELEETNAGVMAMYAQLSEELEETNRGVVALYAELDEKGRQLQEANDAKTRFLRNVSHELRTPVNAVLGLASLLAESAVDDEQRAQVGYLAASARELLAMVNELLDLARVESGRIVVEMRDVSIGQLFAELRGVFSPLVSPDVSLVVSLPEPDLVVRTDADLLARVLRNLLMNAVKFTSAGEVRLGAEVAGDVIRLWVADTGVGIAPEDQPRVFEEFFQVPGEHQVAGRGTGLGLPYARSVVLALGGTLSLESEVGAGSTFRVELPVSVAPEAEPMDLMLGHVLVIDDEAGFRAVVRHMLTGVSDRISEAADGAEALDRLDELEPDLVLVDLRMPRLDGAAFIARLRGAVRSMDLPVVLMSSAELDDVALAAIGARAFVPKSGLDRTTLVAALVKAVGADGRRTRTEDADDRH